MPCCATGQNVRRRFTKRGQLRWDAWTGVPALNDLRHALGWAFYRKFARETISREVLWRDENDGIWRCSAVDLLSGVAQSESGTSPNNDVRTLKGIVTIKSANE